MQRAWALAIDLLRANGSMSKTPKRPSKTLQWSSEVTKHSDALDLESNVFKGKDPHRIAVSLKRSAERSKRRKGTPYQSAMSMLNFYINRAGKNLPKSQKQVLERAKGELREVFGHS
jgi:hypothetical protein